MDVARPHQGHCQSQFPRIVISFLGCGAYKQKKNAGGESKPTETQWEFPRIVIGLSWNLVTERSRGGNPAINRFGYGAAPNVNRSSDYETHSRDILIPNSGVNYTKKVQSPTPNLC
jgi:hypothetical protein